MSKIFDRGDIIRLKLDPVAGNEIQGDMRPALVLTEKKFNRLGLTVIAAITQGGNHAREAGFAVPLLGAGTATQGVVLTNSIRSLDPSARNAVFVEKLDPVMTDDILQRVQCLFDCG